MYYIISKDQIKQAIKAYGDGLPNSYYVMKYKGDNEWAIYLSIRYNPKRPYKPPYLWDYDAYYITDKTGKPLDIRVLNTKDCFRERVIDAYYEAQHKRHDTLCISNIFIISNIKYFRFKHNFCSVWQYGGANVIIDYRVKGRIYWL